MDLTNNKSLSIISSNTNIQSQNNNTKIENLKNDKNELSSNKTKVPLKQQIDFIQNLDVKLVEVERDMNENYNSNSDTKNNNVD